MTEVIEIPAVSIDEYLGKSACGFYKMDIQGAEYFALKGMKSTILSNPNIIFNGILDYWIRINKIISTLTTGFNSRIWLKDVFIH
ncbi:MAG: FkbM family methyltransferase [Bacteroidetes bacterium]|nr:FkbM family methyltransferase [Bacteroidota bacterium]